MSCSRCRLFLPAIIQRQKAAFITTSNSQSSQIYHPALLSLYTHFISTLVDICFPSTHDPHEHAYIAAARWPGFIQPVLDAYKLAKDEDPDLEFTPPTEDIRMRLIRLFTPSMDNALESLYPRLTNARDWAKANVPEYDILTKPYTYSIPPVARVDLDPNDGEITDLPTMFKYILVAAFLASTNPAKSDLRMFGRGLDEKKRKRRGPVKRTARSGPAKVYFRKTFSPSDVADKQCSFSCRYHNGCLDRRHFLLIVLSLCWVLCSKRMTSMTDHRHRNSGSPASIRIWRYVE